MDNHTYYFKLLILITLLTNCKKEEITDNGDSQNLYETTPLTIQHSYKYGSDVSKHWERTIVFPVTGRFVQESHYVTNRDIFPQGRLFPSTVTENINHHLSRSFDLYLSYDNSMLYNSLYNNIWKTQWTPSEGGEIGQGSVGNIQATELTPESEMWMMTMMWAPGHRPARGTKFLISYNNRRVVVIAGYETGPGSQTFMGGVTCEVHSWLRADNNSSLKVEYLKNQSVPVGPVM